MAISKVDLVLSDMYNVVKNAEFKYEDELVRSYYGNNIADYNGACLDCQEDEE